MRLEPTVFKPVAVRMYAVVYKCSTGLAAAGRCSRAKICAASALRATGRPRTVRKSRRAFEVLLSDVSPGFGRRTEAF